MINIGFNRYKKFLPVVIYTVFALIFIGSLVRSTGSGMGCPDWPKCFGRYIPPTHIDQLPENYKELYKVAGRQIADFSAVKTWIEYTNRLFGAWTGIALLILSFLSLKIKKSHRNIFWLTQLSLLFVIFNGWLGSKVVQTHLQPGIITLHMILAMILVFLLIKTKYLVWPSNITTWPQANKFHKISVVLFVMLFIQIILGTQVREQIDHITNSMPDLAKYFWVEKLDNVFFIHRSFSIVLLIGFSHLLRNIIRNVKDHTKLVSVSIKLFLCLLAEVVAGAIIVYFNFPGIFQSLHLIFSILMISYTFEIMLILSRKSTH